MGVRQHTGIRQRTDIRRGMGIRQRTGIRQCTGIRQRAGIRRCAHRQQLVNIAGERMKSIARTSAAERSVSKKCELLKEVCIEYDGRTLYRIRALRDFRSIKQGDLGGYIEKEENLSHEGEAWVFDNARVSDNAWVSDDAKVYGNAQVSGNARRGGNSRISQANV